MGMLIYHVGRVIKVALIGGIIFLVLYWALIQFGGLTVEHQYYWSMAFITYVIIISFTFSFVLLVTGSLALGADRIWIKKVASVSRFDVRHKKMFSIPIGVVLIVLGISLGIVCVLLVSKYLALSRFLSVKFLQG